MSEERELLELAAKAAGRDLSNHYWSESGFTHIHTPSRDGKPCQWTVWNPLTDDGDALRLAVKLGMEIHIEPTFVRIWTRDGDCEDTEVGSDPYAATRRAIVRAAAAIGKEMP